MSTQITKYDEACRAVQACVTVDEAKDWADKAKTMAYYQRIVGDKELELQAREIGLRAERQIGLLMQAQRATSGLNKGGRPQETGFQKNPVSDDEVQSSVKTAPPTLAQAGIDKNQADRSRKLAALSDTEFEAGLAEKREAESQAGARVTKGLLKKGAAALRQAPEPEPANDADTGQSIDELIAEIQKENEQLHAQLKAMEADDTKAELRKALLQRDHAIRQQSEAMDKAHKSQDREKWAKRQLMRCGKAVGEEDPDKIAAAVEAFIRQYRKAA